MDHKLERSRAKENHTWYSFSYNWKLIFAVFISVALITAAIFLVPGLPGLSGLLSVLSGQVIFSALVGVFTLLKLADFYEIMKKISGAKPDEWMSGIYWGVFLLAGAAIITFAVFTMGSVFSVFSPMTLLTSLSVLLGIGMIAPFIGTWIIYTKEPDFIDDGMKRFLLKLIRFAMFSFPQTGEFISEQRLKNIPNTSNSSEFYFLLLNYKVLIGAILAALIVVVGPAVFVALFPASSISIAILVVSGVIMVIPMLIVLYQGRAATITEQLEVFDEPAAPAPAPVLAATPPPAPAAALAQSQQVVTRRLRIGGTTASQRARRSSQTELESSERDELLADGWIIAPPVDDKKPSMPDSKESIVNEWVNTQLQKVKEKVVEAKTLLKNIKYENIQEFTQKIQQAESIEIEVKNILTSLKNQKIKLEREINSLSSSLETENRSNHLDFSSNPLSEDDYDEESEYEQKEEKEKEKKKLESELRYLNSKAEEAEEAEEAESLSDQLSEYINKAKFIKEKLVHVMSLKFQVEFNLNWAKNKQLPEQNRKISLSQAKKIIAQLQAEIDSLDNQSTLSNLKEFFTALASNLNLEIDEVGRQLDANASAGVSDEKSASVVAAAGQQAGASQGIRVGVGVGDGETVILPYLNQDNLTPKPEIYEVPSTANPANPANPANAGMFASTIPDKVVGKSISSLTALTAPS